MKQLLIIILIFALFGGLYYFIKSAREDVVDPNLQFVCNERLATMRFVSEEARTKYYQDCIEGKLE